MLRESVIAEVAAKQRATVMKRTPGLSRLQRLKDAPFYKFNAKDVLKE